MPFTPSHAVVALPFVRTPLVPAAIAIGAMTPDLPLFVRGTPLDYGVTHDLRWLPLTMLVALLLLLLWCCVLRPATRELSPRWLAARLPAGWDAPAGVALRATLRPGRRGIRLVLLVASLAVGVVTHVVWDAFTHEDRAGLTILPGLTEQWGPLVGYKWLQYGSSVAGLAILGVAAVVWLRGRTPTPVRRRLPGAVRLVAWLSLPVILVVGAIAGYVAFGPFDVAFTPQHLGYRVLPPLCAAWGIAAVILCLVVQARSRRPAT